ncbi:uncharacterized protein IL334_002333 [Kwoniella shivajii]|uniref:Malate dehydrogenase n=1 Tax=Kwoniella shivajii TaxID=564305 RepID=A0ABZ1CW48_9TREE|nr:hypothetical protein IL334_002333 [Kwoniella shivajii]
MFIKLIASFIILLPAVHSAPASDSTSAASVNYKSLSSISQTKLPDLACKLPQNCKVSNITLPLSGVASLSLPEGQVVSSVAVGRGIQNYTCTSGVYVSVGALANLFDVSCLYTLSAGFVDPAALSNLLPKMAFSDVSFPNAGKLSIAMHHQFVTTPGSATPGAISPQFSTSSNKVILSRVAGTNDLTDPASNVQWLQLAALAGQGTLAKSVYRLNTMKGQPPTSCNTEGQHLSVQYASMYWFTK